MSRKADIKVCRYIKCGHENKQIDISTDSFKVDGKMYYHSDCYDLKKKGDWKDEKTKADLQYIKNQWELNISKTVVYSQLFHCLNDFISRGIPSDYLVFVLNYIIKNKLNLRYPAGLKYYVDKQEIKDAYEKSKSKKIVSNADFHIEQDSNNSPKFTVNNKPSGFNSIFGNKH